MRGKRVRVTQEAHFMTRFLRLAVAASATLATLLAATPSTAAVTLVHHPRHGVGPAAGNLGWASSNWSGYAVTGAGFTSVTGAWTVQSVSATKKATYSSQWVGIDGFNDSSLIQTGTESDYYRGAAHYDAWWEILPAAETVIPSLPVSPGDRMSASVTSNRDGTWTISISDTTTNKSFSTVQSYSGPQTSAEWVEEAPTVGGRIAPLAHYSSPQTFDPGTVNGGNPGLVASDGGDMIQQGQIVSFPSNPDSDTDGFNVSYGSTQPSPPAS
jgi:peptidase A4-like protein